MTKLLPLLIAGLLSFHHSLAQRVALVLSGGGAKGLAHAGVIKALEENNVPIDYIVGTSMGSIVGGFYAAGYSAEELMQLSLSQDMQNWVKGVISDDYNYYYTQKEPDARWMSVELSLDSIFNASLKTNLADDHALNFALAEHLAQASRRSAYDFDSLLVPFRAMAAEVFTQTEVMLDRGNLADALRASMTVPFFFRPIKLNGQYMFDGGIYNNFPVDIAVQEFKPDIIIGVNVASKVFKEYPVGKDEQLVNSQLLFLMLDKADPSVLGGNIYIEPNLDGLAATDFAEARAIIDSGYVAAMRNMTEIKERIARQVSAEELAATRTRFRSEFKELIFDEIETEGFNRAQASYLNNLLERKNKLTGLEEVKAGYYKIVSEDYFRSMYPRIVGNQGNDYYTLKLSGSPSRKFRLILGGTMTSRSTSNLMVGGQYKRLGRSFTHFDATVHAGRFYRSAKASIRLYFPTYIPFYFEPKYVFNQWDFINSTEILLKDRPPTIVSQTDRNFSFNLTTPLGTYHKLSFSPAVFYQRANYTNTDVVNTDDTLDQLALTGTSAKIAVSQNNLDRPQYATRGEAFEASVGAYLAAEQYAPGSTSLRSAGKNDHGWFKVSISYQKYKRVTGWYGYGYRTEGQFSTFPLLSNFRGTQVELGGYFPLVDSRTLILENFRANRFVAAGVQQMFFLTDNLQLRLEGHIFKPFEVLRETGPQIGEFQNGKNTIYLAGSGGLIFQSPIGPIAFNALYYDDDEQKWGAMFHIGYLLFNNSPFD